MRELKRGHRPQRICLGCRARDDQAALLRIVVKNDGELRVGRLERGRGGYLHRTEACWDAFLRQKSVHRAFHTEVGRVAKEKLILSLRQQRWD